MFIHTLMYFSDIAWVIILFYDYIVVNVVEGIHGMIDDTAVW